ncbi:MAG TPA: hypothetical protein VFV75_03775 [Candidatus Polarisedimenticolaceae bacterium]|nr:hypothetical protein [Candidatus Polarisedimenticolaceae bacterium]
MACEKPYLFLDAELLKTYEPRLRRAAVDWLSAHAGDLAAVHVLACSPLARMAMTLTSLTVGGVLISHQERASFDAALCEAISSTLDDGAGESAPFEPSPVRASVRAVHPTGVGREFRPALR